MKTSTCFFLSYLVQFFLEREMLHAEVVERIKKYILCSIIFFNSAAYEIMLKNKVEPNRP